MGQGSRPKLILYAMSKIIVVVGLCQSTGWQGRPRFPTRRAQTRFPGALLETIGMSTTISEYIASDLAGRIGTGESPPSVLTLHALSRHYCVSPTPVRQAIGRLLASGVLVRRPNGRVEVNPSRSRRYRRSPGLRSPVAEHRSPRQPTDLEPALVAEVIRSSLRGDTGYLREEATAQRFGVGRTVLRQGLLRLAGRGLVVHVPRCGWRVRAFDEADLFAYLEVREVLELKALALAQPYLVEGDLRRMLTGNVGRTDALRLDNSLHSYLIEKSGNAYLRDFFSRHGAYYTSLLDFAAPETHVVAAMARQHRAILWALIARDWPRARRTLVHHIRAQRPVVRELLHRFAQPNSTVTGRTRG